MAKGYWIGRIDVTDPDAYKQIHRGQCGGIREIRRRFIVRGGRFETVEGNSTVQKCRDRVSGL